jgi:hypothetical protein
VKFHQDAREAAFTFCTFFLTHLMQLEQLISLTDFPAFLDAPWLD